VLVSVGLGVGPIIDAEADGFTDATFVVLFAVFVAALDAVVDALLAAWLLLVDDVQPATKSDATITSTITATFLITCLT
jgi:hypothetical protein